MVPIKNLGCDKHVSNSALKMLHHISFMAAGLWLLVYGCWFMAAGLWLLVLRYKNAVSGAGDVNKDGFDDIVVSANQRVYVLYGGTSTPGDNQRTLTDLDGTNGFTFLVRPLPPPHTPYYPPVLQSGRRTPTPYTATRHPHTFAHHTRALSQQALKPKEWVSHANARRKRASQVASL